MRTLLLASAAILASLPALAGSITISVTTPAVTGSKTYTISDADAAKLLSYVKDAYPTRANPACNPTCPEGQNPTLPNSNAQSLAAWADGIIEGTRGNVVNFLKEQAGKTARDAVAPVDIK